MRPPPSLAPHDTGGRVCQAIRRFTSYSMTSLVIEYGRPIFIDMPNCDPRVSRSEPALASRTVPDPSMSRCRLGSANRSKIFSGGAGITRSADATSFGVGMAGWYRDAMAECGAGTGFGPGVASDGEGSAP